MEKISFSEVALLKLGGFQFTVLEADILEGAVLKQDVLGFTGGKIHEISKAFRKVNGLSPSEYRKQKRGG